MQQLNLLLHIRPAGCPDLVLMVVLCRELAVLPALRETSFRES